MGRLIMAAVIVFVVIVVAALIVLPRAPQRRTSLGADLMPDSFRTIAFILLVILMLGITTGWMGVV